MEMVCGGVLIRGLKECTSSGLATGAQFFFPLCLPYKIVINPAMPQKHVVKLIKANLESAVLDYLWSDLNLRMKP